MDKQRAQQIAAEAAADVDEMIRDLKAQLQTASGKDRSRLLRSLRQLQGKK